MDLSCKQTEDRQLFVNKTHPDRLNPFLFPSVTGLSITDMTGEAEEEEEEEEEEGGGGWRGASERWWPGGENNSVSLFTLRLSSSEQLGRPSSHLC